MKLIGFQLNGLKWQNLRLLFTGIRIFFSNDYNDFSFFPPKIPQKWEKTVTMNSVYIEHLLLIVIGLNCYPISFKRFIA